MNSHGGRREKEIYDGFNLRSTRIMGSRKKVKYLPKQLLNDSWPFQDS